MPVSVRAPFTGAERCSTISAVLANLHFPFYFILILNEGQNNIISFS